MKSYEAFRREKLSEICTLRDGADSEMAPLPHGKQIQTPINSAFGATTGRAAKKMGGLDMLEAFSMRKP